MKKIFRDILVIALLFTAVLAVPLLSEEFSSPAPATKPAPAAPEISATPIPPMPVPLSNEESPIEGVIFRPAEAPPMPVIISENDDSCSLAGVRGYVSSTSDMLSRKGDSIMLGGLSETTSVLSGTIDGGGGVDTLEVHGSGFVNLDGKSLRNVEIVHVRNGVPNEVRIFAAGLARLEGGHAVIDGDGSDKVVLPACLTWGEPVPVTVGDVNYLRYDAKDSESNPASVSIASEVRVMTP